VYRMMTRFGNIAAPYWVTTTWPFIFG